MAENNSTSNYKSLEIVNTGDLSIDYHIQVDTEFEKNRKYSTNSTGLAFAQIGSAAFTGKLINELINNKSLVNVSVQDAFNPLVPYSIMRFPSTFSMIRKFGNHKDSIGNESSTWRVAEFLGRTSPEVRESYCKHWYRLSENALPDILILSEYNQYFRKFPSIWPTFISNSDFDEIPTTFFRCSFPLTLPSNNLLDNLLTKKNSSKELTLLTTIDDLRLNDIYIRQGLSWESTAVDLVSMFESDKMSHLKKAAFVIIMLNNYGAFLYQNTEIEDKKYSLFYSTKQMEENNDLSYRGNMHGLNTGVLLHIIYRFIAHKRNGSTSNSYVTDGIYSGLDAISRVFNSGFLIDNIQEETKDEFKFCFPSSELFSKIKKNQFSKAFAHTFIPANVESHKESWSISNPQRVSVEETCHTIVESGVSQKNLANIPYTNFGDLLIIGRKEIENYREIKKLIASYGNKVDQIRPLSIAVLGEPGSGKSFGIKQIASSIFDSNEKNLEFNLSQLHNKEELIDAFHLIRDSTIKKRTVIAFWDEFDSNFNNEEFGWVKYFLAPMQDGVFYEGSVSHPIGQSIFIFISSKYKSMSEINSAIDKMKSKNNSINPLSAKLVDFKSRLQGQIDIPGINHKKGVYDRTELRLRRSILLRTLLEKHCLTIFEDENVKNKASIDPGLIYAFLNASEYYHGVRSMEAIISMSHLDGKSRFNRSCLPAENQLNLHVNSEEFWKLINK